MNWKNILDVILRLFPLLLYGVCMIICFLQRAVEFVLDLPENKTWLYAFQNSWLSDTSPFGSIAFASLGLCWVWVLLLYLFPAKKHIGPRWMWALIFFFFPVFGIMILVVCPPVEKVRERARELHCLANAKQLSLGLLMYAADNNDHFPENLKQLYPNYISDENVFHCFASRDKTVFSDYDYYGKGKKSTDKVFVILREKIGNHRGGIQNQAMSDGYCKTVKNAR